MAKGKPRKVWVTCFDGVYSMWRGDYNRLVAAAEAGKEPVLADFGAKLIGLIEQNVTDLGRDYQREP